MAGAIGTWFRFVGRSCAAANTRDRASDFNSQRVKIVHPRRRRLGLPGRSPDLNGLHGIAVAESFPVTADSNGNITITFTKGTADQPAINGIEIQ